MCAPLMTLAIEAAPIVDTVRRPTAGPGLAGLVTDYNCAARGDAERATARERSARTRVVSLNAELQAARQSAAAERSRNLASSLGEARSEMEASAAEAAQAVVDYTFAERRLRRAEREKTRVEPLGIEAVRGFALERLRQIEEIVGTWGACQPQRDVSFVRGLRAVFDGLRHS